MLNSLNMHILCFRVQFLCFNGQRFHDDFDRVHQEAECHPGNTWTEPAWEHCIDSKIINWPQSLVYSL